MKYYPEISFIKYTGLGKAREKVSSIRLGIWQFGRKNGDIREISENMILLR